LHALGQKEYSALGQVGNQQIAKKKKAVEREANIFHDM